MHMGEEPNDKLEPKDNNEPEPDDSGIEPEQQDDSKKKSKAELMVSMTRARLNERNQQAERAGVRKYLERLGGDIVDPDDLATRLDRLAELEEAQHKRQLEEEERAEQEALKRGETAEMLSKKSARIKELETSLEGVQRDAQAKMTMWRVERALQDEYLQNNGIPGDVEDAIFLMTGPRSGARFELDDSGGIAIKNPDGTEKTDDEGDKYDIEKYVKAWLRGHQRYVRSSDSRGSGAVPGASGDGVPMTQAEQFREFKRLAEEEGLPTDEAWKRAGLPA